jgi:hypothetical protein
MRYCGRDFSLQEVAEIRGVIEKEPDLTRYVISQRVCQLLGWYKPDGGLKEMSCRVALLRMQADGLIHLPAPRHRHGNRKRYAHRTTQALEQPRFSVPAGALSDVHLELVESRSQSQLWNEYIDRYHYLGYRRLPGAQLRYFAYAKDRCLALFGFGAAAWKVAPRDTFIGWTDEERQRNLHRIVNNHRFLLLPWIFSKNLASKLLGLVTRRLAEDWLDRYGYRPVLLETFVEKRRFRATSYKAANWQYLGDTQGRGKLDTHHRRALPHKTVWVFPLASDFRNALTQ